MSDTKKPRLVAPTEVPARKRRRSFSVAYKLEVLAKADQCGKRGETGAMLRREGLYTSHLSDWRRARARGELVPQATKRGPKPSPTTAQADRRRIAELERENARLARRARRAEALVDLQKKVSELLAQELDEQEETR